MVLPITSSDSGAWKSLYLVGGIAGDTRLSLCHLCTISGDMDLPDCQEALSARKGDAIEHGQENSSGLRHKIRRNG